MAKLDFFDAETVDRQTPAHPWKALFASAFAGAALLTLAFEAHCRREGYLAGDFKNTPSLWAQEFRKATGARTVLLGASRTLFDIDLDVWEEATGDRPIQLALEGTSPRRPLRMLAEREDFRGLVVLDVTPPIFFTNFEYRDDVFEFIADETPARRSEHRISMALERVFAFIEDQTRPKKVIYNALFPVRPGMVQRYDVLKLEIIDADRNSEMWARVADDEAYQRRAQRAWQYGMEQFPVSPVSDEAALKEILDVKTDIDRIRARGGEVVLVQHPYDSEYEPEEGVFPRARFFDRLARETDSVSVTFFDHPALQGYWLPEWSHIEARDAERYTRAFAQIVAEAMKSGGEEAGL